MNEKLIKIAKKLIANENNIDVLCIYDLDASQQDAQECFNFYGGGNQYTLAIDKEIKDSTQVFKVEDVEALVDFYDSWTDYREESYNVLPFEKIKEIIKKTGNLDEINKNCEENFDYTDFENIDEFLEYIKGYDGNVVIYLLNDEAVDAIVEASKPYLYIPSFDEMSNGNYEDIGLELKEGYDSFTSTGYSQGDWIDVIYSTQYYDRKLINHILWDAPIRCIITINGNDYYIDEEFKDIYVYDKDEALEICQKIIPDFDQYYDEVEKLLPEYPKYPY